MSFSCSLGDPDRTHVDVNPSPCLSPRKRIRRKTPAQIARNNARAAAFSRAQRASKDASPTLSQPLQIAPYREDNEEPAPGNEADKS